MENTTQALKHYLSVSETTKRKHGGYNDTRWVLGLKLSSTQEAMQNTHGSHLEAGDTIVDHRLLPKKLQKERLLPTLWSS